MSNPGEALVLAGCRVFSPWELLQFQGDRVDEPMAEALSRLTGTSAQFWLNVQAAYDYAKAHGQE
jgi:plasmid maintenance system antidote protein VapI